ncbi:MAG: FAD-binding oxidoreductase, partial [Paludibacteraceae bacterium]|nr:FAD-binding oxidoreductase [Paludibacteraceae bacterium]
MTSYIERLAWGTDAGFYRYVPEEVLHPKDEAQVQQIIARALREHKSITFRAAGTSLSGQACGPSLLMVTGKKWEQYEVLDEGKRIRLQPGIIGSRVNAILKPYGRRFTPDPASLNSAMVGGIVNNNASGMVCGVHANSYRMLDSVRLILADGTILDTGDEISKASFRVSHPQFVRRIEDLRDRTLANKRLTELIRKKYSIKNVTGLTILPFVEYQNPFDIIAHLIVGSEGTLAFLSSIVMKTGEDYGHTASALLLFPTTESACRCVTELKQTGAPSAVEYFDRRSMRVVEQDFPELQGLPEDAGAELLKVEASTAEELQQKIRIIEDVLAHYTLCQPARFTQDPALVGKYWAMRSGIFPAVGGTRPIGTTCLIEDIAFPIEHLAEATADLRELFEQHNYPDAVIYGHAFEGNYHFILNQRFDTEEAVAQYDAMMHAVVDLVVDKYHGSLKAEHGTGRNMAPFVRREWGDDAYQLMQDVKALFDPQNLFNPGVIFNEDPASYIQHIKPLPEVHPLVDRCIECGFCEVNCVACGFTKGDKTVSLSSRQRIIVQREIARLMKEGKRREAASLRKAFRRMGKDLCAGDGLCSTSCPVGINTGEFIHVIRELEMSAAGKALSHFAASHFEGVAGSVGSVLTLANVGRNILGDKAMQKICNGLHHVGIPQWTPSIPQRTPADAVSKAKKLIVFHDPTKLPEKVVYFPSCLNQRLGVDKRLVDSPPKVGGVPAGGGSMNCSQPLVNEMTELLGKASYEVIFPENMSSLCCGTIWESKGDHETADRKAEELLQALLKASDNGRYPILCDQSPCLHRMRKTMKDKGLQLYEPVEFIDKFVLDKVSITKLPTTIAVHATCSTRLMGLVPTLLRVAQACAEKVVLPEEIGCCAFAGDKGFTDPELNQWAL